MQASHLWCIFVHVDKVTNLRITDSEVTLPSPLNFVMRFPVPLLKIPSGSGSKGILCMI